MKKNRSLLIVILAFVLLIGGAYVLYNKLSQGVAPDQLTVQDGAQPQEDSDGENSEGEAEKTLAPDFTVYDREGNEVHLSGYVGKPVVLNFWASWCGPCRKELPDFDAASQELAGAVQFLMVNMTGGRETKEQAEALIRQEGYSFPVYYDLDQDAAITYGVNSLPTTLFLDAEGRGIAQARGTINRETLQRGIDMILP